MKWFLLIVLFWAGLAGILFFVRPTYGAIIFTLFLIAWFISWLFVFRKTKQKVTFVVFLPVFMIFTWTVLQITFVQNMIVSQVTSTLSHKLQTKVGIRHISYHFFDKMDMQGLMVEDLKHDTLLFAGSAKVNITDWFFIKDKATLQYLELSDAVVNMNRKDSVWNYQFLVDFFASPKKENTGKAGIEFDFKDVQLNNIRFNQHDQWVGKNMTLSVKKLDVTANAIDFIKKQVNLSKVLLDVPVFREYGYVGNREKQGIKKDTTHKPPVEGPLQWNNAGWVIKVGDVELKNGIYQNERETERLPYEGMFDGQHMIFGSINGHLKNVSFEKDTLKVDFQLATKERSGFEVKKIKANMTFTPEIMEFNNLELNTNHSHLGNYYAMKFRNFGIDMGNFIHNITLDANFENSELDSDDLAFFAPDVQYWRKVFALNGHVRGTVDNLTARKMRIKSGNSTLDGDIALRGLPDIKTTFIDFRANDLQTSFTDVTAIVPSLKRVTTPALSKLGNIRYEGNFTGFINDFVAFGTIKTDLGTVTGDINMKLPANNSALYLGKISTDNFNLGKFLNSNDLGNITFNGKVNGQGFTTEKINANFDGEIRRLHFANYDYQNISIKGDFKKLLFNGLVSINDPNLKVDQLTGSIDLNGKEPQFNFDADLAKANFKQLKLTNESFDLRGHFNLNFTGSNIDNFLGTAKIYNASLLHDSIPLSFDSLVLQSAIIDNKKHLTLQSNNIDASVIGQFKIIELPDAFKTFLSRYYPAYIKKPSYAVANQDFDFEIRTKEVDAYMQLIDPKLKGFNDAIIKGNLKLKENQFNVDANVPVFSYDGKIFNNTRLDGKGTMDTLVAQIDVDEVVINDSLRLPATNLVFRSHNDTSDISLKTSASKALSDASINAQIQTLSDGVKIHFFPSSFIINDKKWELEKDGELTLSKSQVSASEVKFIQGNQQIKISTEPSEILTSHDVVVSLEKVNLDDFAPFIIKTPRLEGLLTGTVRISDPFGKPIIEAQDTYIEKFHLDNDSIGLVNVAANYSGVTGKATFKVGADSKENLFNIEGSYNAKDSTGNQLDVGIVAERLDLKILNNFLGGIFTDIRGMANTSDLRIAGNPQSPSITGTANINEGSLIVNYTQCKYLFRDETIIFNPNEIDFGTIKLSDTLKNTATLSGKMYHKFFKEVEFDNVKIETDKLLVLNTKKKDNNQFYGKVIGKADLRINGPVDDMTMDISGEPSLTDSSHIFLLSGNSIVENGVVDYIDFIQFGTKMEDDYKGSLSSNVLVNLVLTANPACKIDVVLDEATGDIIKGEGNGLLKIRVGNKEPLTINGQYEITKGEYTFNFQTFLKKYFTVNSGTITWNGDPLNAQINITAEYLASQVNFAPLSNQPQGTNQGGTVVQPTTGGTNFNQKEDVRLLAHLTETLLKPKIDFDFELTDGSSVKNDFIISKRLQQLKVDPNELNKQVTSILLFNSFINTTNGTFLNASSGYNVISGTIGGMVSNYLSGFFNKLLQGYVKNTSVYFDVNPVFDNLQNSVATLQAAAKSGLIFTLLKSRLIISAGLNLDYNNPYISYNNNSNVLITPDITAEYLVTKDGRIRVVAFNRTNTDFIGQRNRTGIRLSYRKEAERLTQLFKKVKNPPIIIVPANDSIPVRPSGQ